MLAPLSLRLPLEVLDRVGDIYLLARETRFGQSLVEHSARRPDERATGLVLEISGLFTDKDQNGIARPFAENRLRRVFVQVAPLT